MNYPLISEYIEAIRAAEDNFEELTNLRPVLTDDGQPVMTSGNFAVVFKMEDIETGKFYALKCFTKEQEGREEAYLQISDALKDVDSPYFVSLRYLDKELFVDTEQTAETEFPVLLMDWVEGKTLDKYLRENLDDKYALEMLAYRFSQLAQWLIPQPFAHGDLKPDNILVHEDGTLVLVDYDGMYVPAMRGQKARELGSPDFRHPQRTENDFDEHIDDFPLISILLSLKAISLLPELLEQYGAKDRLIFSEKDYRNLSESRVLEALRPLMQDLELTSLYSLFILAISQNNLSLVSSRLFNLSRPNRIQFEDENLSTEVTIEDLACAWTDEYGAKYSEDRKRLLQAPEKITSYSIRKGTLVICQSAFYRKDLISIYISDSVTRIGDGAFSGCKSLTSIHIPGSVTSIGDGAFSHCESLTSIQIPDSVTSIGDRVFSGCKSLISIHIPNSVTIIGDKAFTGCKSLTYIHIPDNVTSIGDEAFSDCTSLTSIHIPDNVTSIETCVFCWCASLISVHIPDGVTSIGDEAFSGCKSLASIHIPNSVTSIGDEAFSGCKSLASIHIPNSVTSIGDGGFSDCASLTSIHIPDKVANIGNRTFESCTSLTSIHIPDNVASIGNRAFSGCKSLASIHIPNSITSIGWCAFSGCASLTSIHIPGSVTSIGDGTFKSCTSLTSIHIPDNVASIGNEAFSYCTSLTSIHIPDSVTSIEDRAFSLCISLTTFHIPGSVTCIGDCAFWHCYSLATIHIPDSVTNIGVWAFDGCTSLTSIHIPYSVTSIGFSAFRRCESLTSIIIPIGTRKKFEELLPDYKDKLVEQKRQIGQ